MMRFVLAWQAGHAKWPPLEVFACRVAGFIAGIALLDRILLNRTGYLSFLEAGSL